MLPTASHPEAQRAHHHIWASLILYLVSGPLLPFCSLQQVSQISFLKVILFIVTFGRSGSLLQTLLVFSLLVASRADTLVTMLLIAVTSLFAEHGL